MIIASENDSSEEDKLIQNLSTHKLDNSVVEKSLSHFRYIYICTNKN